MGVGLFGCANERHPAGLGLWSDAKGFALTKPMS